MKEIIEGGCNLLLNATCSFSFRNWKGNLLMFSPCVCILSTPLFTCSR